ncbi:MAG: hypothetical protein NDJ90_01400 [Oligoflexia bacterium]|nr:hypothetical protein [Oligoflexia bacterium]
MRGVPHSLKWLPLAVLPSLLCPSLTRADFTTHHWENHRAAPKVLQARLEAAYLLSDTNFDPDGFRYYPATFSSYQKLQTDLDATYGLSARLALFGRASWARIELKSTSRPGNSFGLTDQTLGLNFRVHQGSPDGLISAIDLQAQGDFPLYDNQTTDTEQTPRLGDQTLDGTIGAFVTGKLYRGRAGEVSLTGGGGYTYRTRDFSAALPWSIEAGFEPAAGGFGGQLGLFGVASLSTDPRGESLLTPAALTSVGTGGSYMSDAINPSLATLRGRVTYETSNGFEFFAVASSTVFGRSAPGGVLFAGGVQLSLGKSSAAKDPALMSPREYGKSNQGLVSYAFEARVLRVNDRLSMIKLDKGSAEGVATGQIFDIFRAQADRTAGEAVARAQVTSVKSDEAALTIVEYFKEVWIEEGFIAKRPLQ